MRLLFALVFAPSIGTHAMAQAPQPAEAPTPVAAFFENSAFSAALFSPSGKHLAVRMSKPGRRRHLAVIDLESRTAAVAAEYKDIDIGNFHWVNDERLVYDVAELDLVAVDRANMPGLFAVNRDGSKPIQLAMTRRKDFAPQPWNTFLLPQPGRPESNHVYAVRTYSKKGNYYGIGLIRLDTLTGSSTRVPDPPMPVSEFLLDPEGNPRVALSETYGKDALFYLDPKTDNWRELASNGGYKDTKNMLRPIGFGTDGTLYVAARAGEDFATLRSLDLGSGKLAPEPLVDTPGYDFAGELVHSDRLLGVRLTTDAENEIWFDHRMKQLQATINAALPRTINLLSVPARPGSPWVLVRSYSDQQPPLYRLYDTRSGTLEPIGTPYPAIDPARMGTQEPIAFQARDGLKIPGLLTLPPGGQRKNLPMVVLVHGGPWARGASWGWRPDTQFLASRGYVVLEVEFRGSTGFGARHFEAGLKQWGLAMQDDIADGTRWAIAQGYANPHRICIAGASYGGYAALMGLVRDPDLYKCAFEWLGVTDIELMYTGTWANESTFTDGDKTDRMPWLIGDPVKDAEQLKATSPIEQAARIRQPLLLAYGSEDWRVRLDHGKRFRSAVARTNRNVEWVVYDGEGHGWSLPKNRIDFWQRVERFLGKHIGAVTN